MRILLILGMVTYGVLFNFTAIFAGNVENESDTIIQSQDEKNKDASADKLTDEIMEKYGIKSFDDIKNKIKDEETGKYSIVKYFDLVNQIMEDAYGSLTGEEGLTSGMDLGFGGSKFKKAKFKCHGSFQVNSVYFFDRDVNGSNGSATRMNFLEAREVRTQTNEIEAFSYHKLKISPSIEFANGLISLNSSFSHGSFVWEAAIGAMDLYISEYPLEMLMGGDALARDKLNVEQLNLDSIYLKMLTPLGLGIVGQFGGAPGFIYGIPLSPRVFAGGLYFKILESGFRPENRAGLESHGWHYTDVQIKDDYQDQDDINLYGIGGGTLLKVAGGDLAIAGGVIKMLAGSQTKTIGETDLNIIAGSAFFKSENFRMMGLLVNYFGPIVGLAPGTEFGDMVQNLETMINQVVGLIDPQHEHYGQVSFSEGADAFKAEPTWCLGVRAFYDIGKFTYEGAFSYLSGFDSWYTIPGYCPRGLDTIFFADSYLLKEIEGKYMGLIGPPPLNLDTFSLPSALAYQNMTAMQVGTTYRINKYFGCKGQAIAAWRTDTGYYEKDYWDLYFIGKGLDSLKTWIAQDGSKKILGILYLQLNDEDYYEATRDIDPFLGIELNGKFTWYVREGLDISLMGAYFKIGNFYKSILTPKLYSGVKVEAGTTGNLSLDLIRSGEPVWAPNETAYFFDPADSYTLQMKIDLRF